MSEEEKEKTPAKKEAEELRKEIEQKGREIQELKKKVEELRTQTSQDKTRETAEIDRMLEQVSEILDLGFSMFGISSDKQDKKAESRGLTGLIGDLAKLAEESGFYRKEVDFGGKRGVIDFSVRARPLVRSGRVSFARLGRRAERRETSVRLPVEPTQKGEPLVDIFDEEDSVKVVAEIPGAGRDDVNFEVAGNLLTIKVDTPTGKYCKEVKLPTTVEKEIVETAFRNGIFEVKLKKRE